MANFFRLVAALLLGVCSAVNAADCVPNSFSTSVGQFGGSGSSASEACSNAISAGNKTGVGTWKGGATGSSYPSFCNAVFTPTGGTPGAEQSAFISGDYQCKPPPPPAPPPSCGDLGTPAGGSSSSQYGGGAGYTGGTLCVAGCLAYPGSSWKSPTGAWYARGPLTNVGVSCSGSGGGGTVGGGPPSDSPPPQDPPVKCGMGQCPGTVNGLDICVACSSGHTGGDTSVGPPTDNSGTPLPPTPPASGPGSGSTPGAPGTGTTPGTSHGDTTCTVDKCTTTIINYPPPGGAGGGGGPDCTLGCKQTTTEPKDEYCVKHPKSVLCVDSSFGGSCKGGFQCSGDAVFCAIAQEQHNRGCSMFEDVSPESTLYDLQKGKEGAQVKPEEVAVSSDKFDQSNLLGVSASCVPDKQISINVSGHSFAASIPLSQVCPYLGWLGFANMACAFLAAAMIVGRG